MIQVANTVVLEGYRDTTERSSEILSLDLIGEKEINGLTHKYVLGYESIDTSNDNDRFYMDTNGLDNNAKGEKITTLLQIHYPSPLIILPLKNMTKLKQTLKLLQFI